MRPILSATGTYNFALAKWLDEKLKPLSINKYTITDVFQFADEMYFKVQNVRYFNLRMMAWSHRSVIFYR